MRDLSAILGVPIPLVVNMAGKKKDGIRQTSSETGKQEDALQKEVEASELHGQGQYRNPWPMNTWKRHSDPVPDIGFNGNANYVSSSADVRSPQHGAAIANRDCQKRSTSTFFSAMAQRGVSLLEDAYSLLFCTVVLYQQLLHYKHPCGYPGPTPKESGRTAQLQGDTVRSSRKTCCRCHSSFIAAGGEYYATDASLFQTERRNGSELSCSGTGANQPRCEFSEYYVCIEEAQRKGHMPARGFVSVRPQPGVADSEFAQDCEMCFTICGAEVTKLSAVGCNGAPFYSACLTSKSLDCDTANSGATAEHLRNVRTTLQDVQAVLLRLFAVPVVLVGHGLENDLLYGGGRGL